MTASARFSLPFLASGQAQKEISHNEALQMLDLLVSAAVEEGPLNAPPASPAVGATYIVGPGASGDWAGRDNFLAGYTEGGWRYIPPRDGTIAYVAETETWAVFRGGTWEIGSVRGDRLVIDGEQVVGTQGAAIAAPAGGATVDAEARTTLGQILSALRTHGLIAAA